MVQTNTTSMERRIKSLIPAGSKKFVLGILTHPAVGRIVQKINPKTNVINGVFDYTKVTPKEAARIYWGVWESAEIRFAKRFANSKTIIELGSSVGVTLGTLANNRKDTHFICIEASPQNFETLSALKNHLPQATNRYDFINNAIAYDADFINFEHQSTTGSRVNRDVESGDNTIKIPATTLSGILKTYQVEGPFTLITDIEGAEADIFFKDADALARCETIVCELENLEGCSYGDQVAKLVSLGFIVSEQYGNVFALKKDVAI